MSVSPRACMAIPARSNKFVAYSTVTHAGIGGAERATVPLKKKTKFTSSCGSLFYRLRQFLWSDWFQYVSASLFPGKIKASFLASFLVIPGQFSLTIFTLYPVTVSWLVKTVWLQPKVTQSENYVCKQSIDEAAFIPVTGLQKIIVTHMQHAQEEFPMLTCVIFCQPDVELAYLTFCPSYLHFWSLGTIFCQQYIQNQVSDIKTLTIHAKGSQVWECIEATRISTWMLSKSWQRSRVNLHSRKHMLIMFAYLLLEAASKRTVPSIGDHEWSWRIPQFALPLLVLVEAHSGMCLFGMCLLVMKNGTKSSTQLTKVGYADRFAFSIGICHTCNDVISLRKKRCEFFRKPKIFYITYDSS